MTANARPTLLLVHGAWHGRWAWAELEPELHARGWNTRTVQLPSSSSSVSPQRFNPGVEEDSAAVVAELASIDGPVVVLAHSYGGIPASQATANARNVTHLVFLASYQLDVGESMFSFHGAPGPASLEGVLPVTGEPRAMFYADVPDALAEWAIARLSSQSLRSCAEPLTGAGWHAIPSSYIICEQDGALPVELQERLARRGGRTYRLPSGHSPFLSMPDRLADLLTQLPI